MAPGMVTEPVRVSVPSRLAASSTVPEPVATVPSRGGGSPGASRTSESVPLPAFDAYRVSPTRAIRRAAACPVAIDDTCASILPALTRNVAPAPGPASVTANSPAEARLIANGTPTAGAVCDSAPSAMRGLMRVPCLPRSQDATSSRHSQEVLRLRR
jgi:hypothetical protein